VTYACDGIGAFSSSSSSPILQSGADLGHGCEALVGSWWDGGQTAQTLDAVLQKGQTMPEKNRFPAVLVPDTAHSLRAEGFDASEDGTGRGTPLVPISIRTAQTSSNGCGINEDGTSYTLDGAQGQAIAFDCKASGQNGFGVGEIGNTMRGAGHGGGHQAVMNRMQVRRLTPRECERLQGFPDDYTLIPITKRQPINGQPAVVKWAADGPRYKALGNSMAVPVMRWIGERIAMVDAIPLASEIAA
jgi:DNA (cytosine-5)-methyltransferase 1